MIDTERAEHDRLKAENGYLLSRLVEMDSRLISSLESLTSVLAQLSKAVAPVGLPKLLTPEQVADVLGVTVKAVYGWVASGSIPYRRVGRLPRFELQEIMDWTVPANSKSGKKQATVIGLPRQS